MKRKTFAALLGFVLTMGSLAGAAAPRAPRQLTLLVVPARFSVLQVAFDVAARYPVVLVSYQGEASTDNPLLHAWNGREWLYVSMQDFREANFLQVTPGRAILVGDETVLPSVLVTTVSGWCPKVMTVPALDHSGLVNALGVYLSFTRGEWEWFARRYNMSLQDLNVDRRQESWYDQPGYRDEWTERLREIAPRQVGRPGRGAAARPPAALAPAVVPPAEIISLPSEGSAPVMPPRLSIPPAEEETPAPVEKSSPPKQKRQKAETLETPPPAEVSMESPGTAPPPGWQEKATATELPVK